MKTSIFRAKFFQYALMVLAFAGLYFIVSTIINYIVPVKQIKVSTELLYKMNATISNSTGALRNNCQQVLAAIEQQMKNYPYRVTLYKEKADSVHQAVDSFIKRIQGYSNLIVQENGGWMAAKNYKDENDSAVMKGNHLVNEENSFDAFRNLRDKNEAEDLYILMVATHDLLLGIIDDPMEKEAFDANLPLNIDDKEGKTFSREEWLQQNFQGIPVINLLTFLNKLQNDAVVSEQLALLYLLNRSKPIEDFYRRIQPAIIAPTSYVLQGDVYTADIFLLESSITVSPKILIGRLNSNAVKNEDGTYLETVENPVDHGVLIPNRYGLGHYSATASDLGTHHYTGAIKTYGPDGSFLYYPFEGEYTVGKKCD